jgi:16S rRNA (guanine966-N2)-methyltransferase
MRIVAGEWRGRQIDAPAGRDVRPTLDRVREAWMSILQREIPGSTVVDLFAGSGALGLEALSRGAVAAHFVEKDPRSIRVIGRNIELLSAGDRARVERNDALEFASELAPGAYDIAFADPPYSGDWAARLAEVWAASKFARILSIEHSRRDSMPPGGDTRRYGDSAITFYRSEE